MIVRAGVIGAGAMGDHHCRNYSAMASEGRPVRLAGVHDVDASRAAACAARYGCAAFEDPASLLANVDAVTVAVPTTLHEEYACAALDAGVHVLVEKPIASTIEQAESMARRAESAGRILTVGHLERMNPAIAATRDFVAGGGLGEVVSVSARRVGPHNPRIRDVGVILDLGIHDIDVIAFVIGARARRVSAMGGRRLHSFEDYAAILLGFPMDRVGMCVINWLTPKKVRKLTVVGTEGVIEVDYLEQRAVLLRDPGGPAGDEIPVSRKEPLRVELEAFVASVMGEVPAAVPASEGIEALKAALAAVESLREGREVELG